MWFRFSKDNWPQVLESKVGVPPRGAAPATCPPGPHHPPHHPVFGKESAVKLMPHDQVAFSFSPHSSQQGRELIGDISLVHKAVNAALAVSTEAPPPHPAADLSSGACQVCAPALSRGLGRSEPRCVCGGVVADGLMKTADVEVL